MKNKLHQLEIDSWQMLLVELAKDHLEIKTIILFGSFALGTQSRRSDVDLAIVMETSESFLNRGKVIHGKILKIFKPYPVDFLIYTPEEFERMKVSGNRFIKKILEAGKVLYER
jgi:predicted nucleotidyltransferase